MSRAVTDRSRRLVRQLASGLVAGSLLASGAAFSAPVTSAAQPGGGEIASPAFLSSISGAPEGSEGAFGLTAVSVNELGTRFLLGGSFTEYQQRETQGLVLVDRAGELLDTFELRRTETEIEGYTFNFSTVTSIAPIQGTCTFLVGGVFADASFLKKVSACGNRLREVEDLVFPQPRNSRRDARHPYYGFNGVVHDIEAIGPRNFLIAGQFNRFSDKRVNGFGEFTLNRDGTKLTQSGLGRLESKLNMANTYFPGFTGRDFVPSVRTITQDSNGIVYIGGDFTRYDSQTVGGVVALDAFGNLYHTFSGGVGRRPGTARPDVRTVEVVGFERDRVMVGGAFNGAVGMSDSAPNLVQFSAAGAPLPTLLGAETSTETCFGTQTLVQDVARMPDGNYIVSGNFTAVRGSDGQAKQSLGVARLDANLNVDFTWNAAEGAGFFMEGRSCNGFSAVAVPNETRTFDILIPGNLDKYVAPSGVSLATQGAVKLSPGATPENGSAERGSFKAKAPVVQVQLPLEYARNKLILPKAAAQISFGTEGDLAWNPLEQVRLRTIYFGTRGANERECVFQPFSDSADATGFGTNTITYVYPEGSPASLLPWSAGDYLCVKQVISTDRDDYVSPTTEVQMIE